MAFPASLPHRERTERQVGATSSVQHLGVRAWMRAWVCRPGCGPGCAGLGADLGVRAWVRTWVRGPLARIDGEYRAWNRRSYRGERDEAPIRHILSEQQIGRGAAAPPPSIDEVHPWNCETIIRIGSQSVSENFLGCVKVICTAEARLQQCKTTNS